MDRTRVGPVAAGQCACGFRTHLLSGSAAAPSAPGRPEAAERASGLLSCIKAFLWPTAVHLYHSVKTISYELWAKHAPTSHICTFIPFTLCRSRDLVTT